MDKDPEILRSLEAMRVGVDYRLPVSIRNFQVWLRPLANIETEQVATETSMAMAMLPEGARNRIKEHQTFAKKTLVKASTTEPGAADPQLNETLLNNLTDAELDYLFKQYVAATDKVNPALESLPVETIEELVEALKKSPSEAIELSFLQLVNVARFLLTRDA